MSQRLKITIDRIESTTFQSTDAAAAAAAAPFKNYLDEELLFNNENMKSYSECDYVMNLWSSLLEKVFRKSGVIPHWGDTKFNYLASLSNGIPNSDDSSSVGINDDSVEDNDTDK
ncbi:hypothetical protein INT46_006720 [Mucor plumbeus]|uniref:Uncharacterized protein n=1 Tax=Mucor plumbeus TaxID=97098 RepID=A0A8H7QK78_9FUNG|nr:hypothetical protein INT46_006720 [Mucor plumbeus]